MDSKLAKETGADVTHGVYIQDVLENGSAKSAGLEKGDVILKVNDKAINSVAQLQETISSFKPGSKVQVLINRNGKEKNISVLLKNAAGKTELVKANNSETLRNLGADMNSVSSAEAKKLNIAGGIQIKELYSGKLRSQTDIKEGFIITKVNRTPVRTVEELIKALEDTDGGVMLEGIYPGDSQKYYYAFGL
jgi:S1-C subfamily serine protease